MEREADTTGPPRAPGAGEQQTYQPPAVAWEEEFDPMAISGCGSGSGGADCLRVPWQES